MNIKVVINDVNRLTQTIAQLQSEIEDLNEQITTKNTTIAQLTAQVETLNTEITTLETQITQLNSTIEAQAQTISTLQAQITDLDSQITNLNNQITALNAQITSLNQQIASYDLQINQINGETVSDPLTYLSTTKSLILSALQNKGSSATSSTPFRDYATEVFQLNPKGDSHTKLLLRFSEPNTYGDVSMYNNNSLITYSTDFNRSSSIKKFGSYSCHLYSTSSFTIAKFDNPGWQYTYEFWIYPVRLFPSTGYSLGITNTSRYGTSLKCYLFGCYSSTSTIEYRINNYYTHDISTSSLTLNTWHHVAYSRNNTTKYTFLDGVLLSSSSAFSDPPCYWLGSPMTIGTPSNLSNAEFYFDEFRISDVCRYTTNFTPPTEPFNS